MHAHCTKENEEDFDIFNTLIFLANWETKYFLLLWSSILVLIPFHLSRFDSQQEGKAALMDRILKQIKINLKRGDKCQDAAAFLASKFLTRPEIVTNLMPEFLDWAMQIIAADGKDRMDDIGKLFLMIK